MKGNLGSSLARIDKKSLDNLTASQITKISEKLKNQTYKFNPIKRVFIDKTKKNPNINQLASELYKENKLDKSKIKELSLRPLEILTFDDRIVQEAPRLILESIYEPIFKRLSVNFGFRPEKSSHDVIYYLETKAKATYTSIEVDIEGAYDNTDYKVLLNLLKKRIKDNKMLNLIKAGLKSGIFFVGITEKLEVGVTQGSILSPLLFNIYMHQLDLYFEEELKKEEDLNNKEGRKDIYLHSRYNYLSKRKSLLGFPKLKETLSKLYHEHGTDSDIYI